jgi:hypothetical protein
MEEAMTLQRRTRRKHGSIDARTEADAWLGYFETGWDFFRDLSAIGIETDYGRPDPAIAQEAWNRLAHMYETPPKWAAANLEAGA